jgi:hypothetical protein
MNETNNQYLSMSGCSTVTIGEPGLTNTPFFSGYCPDGQVPYLREPKETKTHLLYSIPYPGLASKDIDVFIRNEVLYIEPNDSSEFVVEGQKEIHLDTDLYNINEVSAKCENGVLLISIPKVKEDKTITVK